MARIAAYEFHTDALPLQLLSQHSSLGGEDDQRLRRPKMCGAHALTRHGFLSSEDRHDQMAMG